MLFFAQNFEASINLAANFTSSFTSVMNKIEYKEEKCVRSIHGATDVVFGMECIHDR